MTRINLVHPSLLSDRHLGAEYRELPRVFGLVRAAVDRGETAERYRRFDRYVLGPGHVKFFYARLGWLSDRHAALVAECRRRGREVRFPLPPVEGIGPEWFGDWVPLVTDIQLSISRINERGGLRTSAQQ